MNRPRQPQDIAEWLRDQLLLLAEDADGRLDLDALADQVDRSPRQLSRIFASRFGTTPARFLADQRAGRARQLLVQGHDVLSAAVKAGYSGPGRLHEAMVVRVGMTPGELRAGGGGARIAFGVFQVAARLVLLAATHRGICAIRISGQHSPREHLADLRSEFPRAHFIESPAELQPIADQLAAYLAGRVDRFAPDLDIGGTPFQRQVWEHLRRIPRGETTTYAEIARRIGRPTAARAVAGAIARNPVAIAVPCHRVVRTDGDLGGYRWGVDLKRELLELEDRRWFGEAAPRGAKD